MEGLVSIPFKRESGAKDRLNYTDVVDTLRGFQFPSNGKVEPKSKKLILKDIFGIVSIPFKRESVAKAIKRLDKGDITLIPFQFPSNGKV